jgi:hypothetical protein
MVPPSSTVPRASTAERLRAPAPKSEEQLVPQYFFHVYDDIVAHDAEGLNLPNLDAARLEALRGARELMCDQVRHGYIVRSHWIDVVDERGEKVLTVSFKDAVDVKD